MLSGQLIICTISDTVWLYNMEQPGVREQAEQSFRGIFAIAQHIMRDQSEELVQVKCVASVTSSLKIKIIRGNGGYFRTAPPSNDMITAENRNRRKQKFRLLSDLQAGPFYVPPGI